VIGFATLIPSTGENDAGARDFDTSQSVGPAHACTSESDVVSAPFIQRIGCFARLHGDRNIVSMRREFDDQAFVRFADEFERGISPPAQAVCSENSSLPAAIHGSPTL